MEAFARFKICKSLREPAHHPVGLGSHSGRGVVAKLTLEPSSGQQRWLPCDLQDSAEAADRLHVGGWVGLHCNTQVEE